MKLVGRKLHGMIKRMLDAMNNGEVDTVDLDVPIHRLAVGLDDDLPGVGKIIVFVSCERQEKNPLIRQKAVGDSR